MGTTRVKLIDLSSNEQKEEKAKKKDSPKPKELQEETTTQEAEEIKVAQNEEPVVEEKEQAQAKKPSAKKTVKKQTHHLGKKYKQSAELVDSQQTYTTKDALDLLRKTSFTKFDSTVEVHLNVAVKGLRGKVNFPHSIGEKKEKRYLIFSTKKTDAKNVIWADEKAIADLENGKLKPQKDFDTVVAEPKYMPQLAKVAKILGPRGMMPNPKNGTVTDNPASVLESTDDGTYDFRTDPTAPIVHTKIGKLSFKDDQLSENLKALVTAIGPSKIKKATITSTMAPGIKFDVLSVGK